MGLGRWRGSRSLIECYRWKERERERARKISCLERMFLVWSVYVTESILFATYMQETYKFFSSRYVTKLIPDSDIRYRKPCLLQKRIRN